MNRQPKPGMTRVDWAIAICGVLLIMTIPLWVAWLKALVS